MQVIEQTIKNAPKGPPRTVDPQIVAYRILRWTVGVIAMSLPFALVLGQNIVNRFPPNPDISPYPDISDHFILDSLSSYHWSGMRDLFAGGLCAIGFFLLAYPGIAKWEAKVGDLACVFAVGVALFPCSKLGDSSYTWYNMAHYACAGCLFFILACFCYFSFPKPEPGHGQLPRKPLRIKIYKTCGVVIISCIVAIALVGHVLSKEWPELTNLVFWLETLAIWAFGFSWFVKGGGFRWVQG
jgi:hypothetical protein